jgi:hypothetical protein
MEPFTFAGVSRRLRRADELELRRSLQRNIRRRGHFGGRFGQSAVSQASIGSSVHHRVVLSAALRFIDLPLLSRRLHQHLARSSAGLAQRLPRSSDAQASVCAHHGSAIDRRDARELDANLFPVALQLFGQKLRE